MRFFTKMKRLSLMMAALLTAGTALAQEEYGVVWSQDFENADTYTDGWTLTNSDEVYRNSYSGSYYLHFYSYKGTGGSISFADNSLFTSPTDYKFEFDWNAGYGNTSGRSETLTVLSDNDEGKLFYIKANIDSSADAAGRANGYVYNASGETLSQITVDGYRKTGAFTFMYHILVEASETNGVTLTITKGDDVVLNAVQISESVCHVTGLKAELSKKADCMGFDNIVLSVRGAKEVVSVPTCSITSTNGNSRTITIVPGVGSEGTESTHTYYTLDGSDPSDAENENRIEYTNAFDVVGISCTVKAVSYLADGTVSEISEFAVDATSVISLNEDIIRITGMSGDGDVKNPIVTNVYTNEGVLLEPTVNFSYTFNGETITLPYTIEEPGTLTAIVSADGYQSSTETIEIECPDYVVLESIDFSAVTEENITTLLDDTWTYKGAYLLDDGGNARWASWKEGVTYYYATSSSKNLTDFLVAPDNASVLLVGFGVGRNVNGGRKHTISMDGLSGDEIALYVVDQSYNKNEEYKAVEYASAYMDDPTMPYTVQGSTVLAKVSVYTPVRELVIDDNETACVDFAPEYDKYSKITYNRELKTGYTYGFICLPFAPDAESLTNFQFYTLSSVADDAVTFVEEDVPVANTPYLYSIKEGAARTSTITGGETTVSTEVNNTTVGTWTLVGSLKNETIDCTADATTYNYIFNPAQNTLHRVKTTLTVYPYTAYLKNDVASTQNSLSQMRVFIGTPTGIKEISRDQIEGFGDKAGMFDLQGRALSNPVKGQIYIENGEKKIKN